MSSWAKPGSGDKKPGGIGILNMIPGYSGYRAKESRRDEDKQVRLELARQYDLVAQRLTDVQGDLVRNQRFAEIGNVERLERSLRLFSDRLKTATYGYGGLFSDRPIEEHALDQMNTVLVEQGKLSVVMISGVRSKGEPAKDKADTARDETSAG